MNLELSNPIFLHILEQQQIWIYCGIFSICFGILGLWLKRKRKVNCWFCKKYSYVHKDDFSWWFCKYCEQFNGFDQSGDYVREIPTMFAVTNGCPRYCDAVEKPESTERKQLCEKCQKNQALKIAKLQAFEPSNESTFDMESEEYEDYLNERFKLCSLCRDMFNNEITKQNDEIKQMYAEELRKVHPSSLSSSFRRLKGKRTSRRRVSLRKIAPSVIFLLSVMVLLSREEKYEKFNQKYILASVATAAFILNLLLTKQRKRVHWLQMVSYALWSNFLYSLIYNRDHSLLFSELMVFLEGISVFLQCWHFVCGKWKERRYLRERKTKLDKLTPTRRTLIEDEDQSRLGDSSITDNVSVISEDLNSSITGSVSNELMNAPDLLQGNLHHMYIDRKGRQERSSQRTRNHVVAALKYNSRSLPALSTRDPSSSAIKRPLLRPATFVFTREGNISQNTETSDNTQQINETNTTDIFQQKHEDQNQKTQSQFSKTDDTDNIPKHNSDGKKEKASMYSWNLLLFIFFIISVVLNITFVTMYRYEKRKTTFN